MNLKFHVIQQLIYLVQQRKEPKKESWRIRKKNLPQGKRMVLASLKTGKVVQSKRKGEKPLQRQILVLVVKKPKERSNFKELASENLI